VRAVLKSSAATLDSPATLPGLTAVDLVVLVAEGPGEVSRDVGAAVDAGTTVYLAADAVHAAHLCEKETSVGLNRYLSEVIR